MLFTPTLKFTSLVYAGYCFLMIHAEHKNTVFSNTGILLKICNSNSIKYHVSHFYIYRLCLKTHRGQGRYYESSM